MHQDISLDSQSSQHFKEEQREALRPIESSDDFTDEERMLLPSRIYGFVLRSRRWGMEAISSILHDFLQAKCTLQLA